jgi:hypothetical protein
MRRGFFDGLAESADFEKDGSAIGTVPILLVHREKRLAAGDFFAESSFLEDFLLFLQKKDNSTLVGTLATRKGRPAPHPSAFSKKIHPQSPSCPITFRAPKKNARPSR